jgi:Ran GTPase-activating protein (RanGAP) involved in mRNA processing and transport
MSKGSNLSPAIVAKLKENTVGTNGTHYFDISAMNIGPREVSAIGDCIRLNGMAADGMAPLITLDLSNNSVCGLNGWGKGNYDADGFQEFCNSLNAIHKVSRLKKLILSRNYLDTRGFNILGNFLGSNSCTIVELHVRSCCGTGEAMEKFMDGIKSIKSSLQVLDLRENPLGVKGALCVADMIYSSNRIKQISISACNLQAEGVTAIFNALQNNVSLDILNIGDNFIGDIGSEAVGNALKVNTKLKHLDLQDNGIGLDGITYIAKGLAKNRGIVFLGLAFNNISNEGAAVLGDSLRTNITLKGIHVVGNPMNLEGVKAIIDGSAAGNEKPVDLDLAYAYKSRARVREKKVLKEAAPEGGEGQATEEAGTATATPAAAAPPTPAKK